MDGQKLEQLSSSSGIPLDLLSRSIQARAEASGVTSDDILNSWSGGDAIPAPTAVVAATEEKEIVVEEQVATSEIEEVIEESPAEVQVEEVSAVTTLLIEDAPPPVSISQKILKSLKYGLGFGVLAGFIQGLLASSYLYDGLILEAETQKLIAEYNTVSFSSAVVTTAVGAGIASPPFQLFRISSDVTPEASALAWIDRESKSRGIPLELLNCSNFCPSILNLYNSSLLNYF